MHVQTFIDSVAYNTEKMLRQIADLEEGRRRVFCNGEDVSAKEADCLAHCVIENITIIERLRARSPAPGGIGVEAPFGELTA